MRTVAFTPFVEGREGQGLALWPGQRAFAAVAFDHREPAALDEQTRTTATQIFGPIESVPPEARRVIAMVKGRDVGGTRLAALRLLHLALTLPLEQLDRTEPAFVLLGGPKVKLARIALRHFALPAAKKLADRGKHLSITSETRDSFELVRHDGRRVVFECFAASRAGDTARGVPIIGALLDECAFYRDELTGAVNDRDIFNAIMPRLLPGGQILLVSSPWAESGLLYTEYTRNHGAPSTALAALCPTVLMRNDEQTRRTVETERARDPDNAAREFDAQFLAGALTLFFDPRAIELSVNDQAFPLAPRLDLPAVAAADFGFRSDSSALAIVRIERPRFVVAELLELRPERGKPLQPSVVVQTFAEVCRRHRVRTLATDAHYIEAIREFAAAGGLGLYEAPSGATGKLETHTRARSLLHEGRVQLPNHRRLLAQLRDIHSRPLPGGSLSIWSPRRQGSHGDLASALVLALWAAQFCAGHSGLVLVENQTQLPWGNDRTSVLTGDLRVGRDGRVYGGPSGGSGF